jgi:hypothetical protein
MGVRFLGTNLHQKLSRNFTIFSDFHGIVTVLPAAGLDICIALFEVRSLCPFGCVKDELADRYTFVDFYRTGVDVCHLKCDRAPEPGIDPATILVESDAQPCDD